MLLVKKLIIFSLPCILGTVACQPAPTKSSKPLNAVGSDSSTRVSARVPDANALRGVNAILIAPIVVSERGDDLGTDFRIISDELETSASAELDVQILNRKNLNDKGIKIEDGSNRPQILSTARTVGADTTLFTVINSFSDRVGSALGGQPGHVSFTMTALRAADGKLLWEANYYFKDEALLLNLLKAKDRFDQQSGAGWKDVRSLVGTGFRETLRDLSERRFATFRKS